MVHSLSANFIPANNLTLYASRSKPVFLNPNTHPSSLLPSQSSNNYLTGQSPFGLIICRRSPLPPAHSTNGVPALHDPRTSYQGLRDFLEIEVQVRDYEVDRYGVLNNAVYSSYCQHAHHEFLTNKLGVIGEEYGHANPVAVSHLSFKFLAPLKSREKLVLKVRVSHASVAPIFFEHFIYKLPNYEPILEAKSTLVWLDEKHRPVRLSPELRYQFIQSGLYQ